MADQNVKVYLTEMNGGFWSRYFRIFPQNFKIENGQANMAV